MPSHGDKKFLNRILKLRKDGFSIIYEKKKFTIKKDDGPVYKAHSGTKSYHPIRRFLKNNYNYIF